MLKESIATAEMHLNRANDNYLELQHYNFSLALFENKDQIKTVDAFIFRYIKLQDFMSEKLFRQLLESIGEYKDSMSLLDVLDKLEKLQLIDSADEWIAIRKLRNQLTHEYPDNQMEILAGIRVALVYFASMKQILHSIIDYSQQYRL